MWNKIKSDKPISGLIIFEFVPSTTVSIIMPLVTGYGNKKNTFNTIICIQIPPPPLIFTHFNAESGALPFTFNEFLLANFVSSLSSMGSNSKNSGMREIF